MNEYEEMDKVGVGRGEKRHGGSGKTDADSQTCTMLRGCCNPRLLSPPGHARRGTRRGNWAMTVRFYLIYMSVCIVFSVMLGRLYYFAGCDSVFFLCCSVCL